jgi:hypothetical protein
MSQLGGVGPPAGPVTWTVGVQQVTNQPDGQGNYVPGYLIPFTLSTGERDSVWVALTDYSRDTARAAIAAKAAELVAVANLSGTIGP